MKTKSFEDLEVWKRAHSLVIEVYKLTKPFPDNEKFGLVSQMRRAAISVPANIAEGYRKRGQKDKLNFYNIAQGSLDELKYYLILTKELGYVKDTTTCAKLYDEVIRMLTGYIGKIRGKK